MTTIKQVSLTTRKCNKFATFPDGRVIEIVRFPSFLLRFQPNRNNPYRISRFTNRQFDFSSKGGVFIILFPQATAHLSAFFQPPPSLS